MAAAQYIEQGLLLFTLYTPLLVAFVLAFRALGFFDLSLASASILAAYTFNAIVPYLPGPYAALAALGMNIVSGVILSAAVYLYFIQSKTPPAQMLIVSLGVATVMGAGLALAFGREPFVISIFSSADTALFAFYGIILSRFEVLLVAVCILCLSSLWAFMRFTTWGLWTRAMIDNRSLAADAGIPVAVLTIALGGVCFFLAGITGIGQGVTSYVVPTINFTGFILIMGAALLGAFKFGRSIAALAFLVGVHIAGIALVDTAFAAMLMYGIILLILVIFYRKSVRPGA